MTGRAPAEVPAGCRGNQHDGGSVHIPTPLRSLSLTRPSRLFVSGAPSTDIAILLSSQGRLTDAEALYLECLEGRRATLGERHPSTLTAINNLGTLRQAMGQLPAAEELYREALAGRRATLGRRHPETLSSANNLATLLQAMTRLDEAEARAYASAQPACALLSKDSLFRFDTRCAKECHGHVQCHN